MVVPVHGFLGFPPFLARQIELFHPPEAMFFAVLFLDRLPGRLACLAWTHL